MKQSIDRKKGMNKRRTSNKHKRAVFRKGQLRDGYSKTVFSIYLVVHHIP